MLHVRGARVISGELLFRDKYALRVRVDDRQVFASEFESDNPDDLLSKAAPWGLKKIQPYLNAILEYHDNPGSGPSESRRHHRPLPEIRRQCAGRVRAEGEP